MTRLQAAWLRDPGCVAIMQALSKAGFQTLYVGGCVRNALMGLDVADIDMATAARPERTIACAERSGIAFHPTGIDHGTVTLVAEGRSVEVTTFRRDVQTDGRHAVVAFANEVSDDAGRRDFTMNALYADRDGSVVDPLGGLPDLRARRVRFVGDPETRIAEDHLRILRFFRFHAHYGDPAEGLDADGLAACAGAVDRLPTLSAERIGHEMRKLLAARDPSPSVAAMARIGALAQVLPGADPTALSVLISLEGDLLPDPLRRLAVLGAPDTASMLRLSRADAAHLQILRTAALSGESAATLAWRHGANAARDGLLVRAALTAEPPQDMAAELARGAAARFPIRAADLMPTLQGAALGRRLRALETAWLASDMTLDRDALLSLPANLPASPGEVVFRDPESD